MAKLVILLVVGFVLSPIDLIPVHWYLDDLITVPIGVIFGIRLILSNIMDESRAFRNIFKTVKLRIGLHAVL